MSEGPHELDEVFGRFKQALTTAMALAGRLAEESARRQEQRARQAQAEGEQQTREYAARLAAEQTAAENQLRSVHEKQWWDTAEPHHIAEQYELARRWQDRSEPARAAVEAIITETEARYGVDPKALLTQADTEHVRSNADRQREREDLIVADLATTEPDPLQPDQNLTAIDDVLDADRADITASDAGEAHEHEARARKLIAEGLSTETAQEVIENFPDPVSETVRMQVGKAAKARPTRAASSVRGRQRDQGR